VTKTDLETRLAGVKLVAMDVDGTFTMGELFYDHEGNIIKGFGARDGLGLELLKRAGIPRGFITGRRDPATETRARYLQADFYHCGVGDKSVSLRELCGEFGITLEEIMYIGDDLNDYTAFEIAGVAVAVGDASEDVKKIAHYVTSALGGRGAVREAVELLLKAKGHDLVALWKTRTDVPVGKQ
jgi:3-deoxy-D-manno-octulosonate 8-phosphate phosphatase (KDO 8-P phosphatase)